jgi:hypothetical protein
MNNEVLVNHKQEQNCVIYWKIVGSGDLHFEQSKPNSKSQITCFYSYVDSRSEMTIIKMKMGNECKRETMEGNQWERRGIREDSGRCIKIA